MINYLAAAPTKRFRLQLLRHRTSPAQRSLHRL